MAPGTAGRKTSRRRPGLPAAGSTRSPGCVGMPEREADGSRRLLRDGARASGAVRPRPPNPPERGARVPPRAPPSQGDRRLAPGLSRGASRRATVHYTGCSPAPVAQGIERAPPEREVAGSIPAGRMKRPGAIRQPHETVGQVCRTGRGGAKAPPTRSPTELLNTLERERVEFHLRRERGLDVVGERVVGRRVAHRPWRVVS